LELFATLKGIPSNKVNIKVAETLDLVKLREVRAKKASELSGGMKRKLSVAIALIGDSEIVFLDGLNFISVSWFCLSSHFHLLSSSRSEPTSGMDPLDRKETQELIRKVSPYFFLFLQCRFSPHLSLPFRRVTRR
jgi:ABC-type transporter Mla maintaining outer membrane lipid asymmetry ATPase subunit MlaF